MTLTPHIAGASVTTVTYAAEQAAEEVRRYLAGRAAAQPVLSSRMTHQIGIEATTT